MSALDFGGLFSKSSTGTGRPPSAEPAHRAELPRPEGLTVRERPADSSTGAAPASSGGGASEQNQKQEAGRGFYSLPASVYKGQDDGAQVEREIFGKAWKLLREFYLIGVNEAAWDLLVKELYKQLSDPYQTAPDHVKKLARRFMDAICEYLQARAYDRRIPSRAALIDRQDAETAAMIAKVKEIF